MLTILILVTIVLLVFTIWGLITADDDMTTVGCGLLVITGIFGWLFLGNVVSVRSNTEEIVANVLTDTAACHLSVSNKIVTTYTDVATFNFLSDRKTVKVIKTQGYNIYGSVPNEPTWVISNTQ